MLGTKSIAIVLAVVLFAGMLALGQEEEKESPQPRRAMRPHARMLHKHGMHHAGAGMPNSCVMCRMMLWSSSPVRYILDNQEELGLSTVQIEKLKDMDIGYSMAQIDRKAMLEKRLIRLRHVFDSDPVDLAVLEETLHETSDAWIDMIVAWVEVEQRAVALLTEEQKKMLEQLAEEAATAMRKGRAPEKARRRASVKEVQPGG